MTTISLQNEVVLVTGGTSGIGLAIAKKFAESGAKLVLFGTNRARGEKAVEALRADVASLEVNFYQVDVSSLEAVQKGIDQVMGVHGKVDVLVNCAGITKDNLLMRMKEEEWDRVLEVNLKSCYNTCKALTRPMLKAKKGKIINISSVVGLTGNPGQSNYAASKAGMIGFSKALAKELAGRGIEVNVITPGFVETHMTDALSEKQQEMIKQNIPMGRIGQPEEIAYLALFLGSRWSSYMTGQVISVDGGLVT